MTLSLHQQGDKQPDIKPQTLDDVLYTTGGWEKVIPRVNLFPWQAEAILWNHRVVLMATVIRLVDATNQDSLTFCTVTF